jgi:hypothetical protein
MECKKLALTGKASFAFPILQVKASFDTPALGQGVTSVNNNGYVKV